MTDGTEKCNPKIEENQREDRRAFRKFIVLLLAAMVVGGCEFPYKSRVMGTSEPLKPLKAPYMARNPVKWGFFRLKGQEIPLKI